MTESSQATAAGARRIACAKCGATFGCIPDAASGRCWCGAEPFRLPVPLPPEAGAFDDCLCPSCLREVARSLAHLAPSAAVSTLRRAPAGSGSRAVVGPDRPCAAANMRVEPGPHDA
jgi:hypothetical protein